MPTSIARQRVERHAGAISLAQDVSAPGLDLHVDWPGVPGATGVEVTEATLVIESALAEETFPDVPISAEDPHKVVTVPEGRAVSALGLDVTLLPGENLTLSLPSARGGWDAPLFASTAGSSGPMAPPTPEGATLANGVFRLPRAVPAAKLRLSKVTGDSLADFAPIALDLSRVNLTATTPPRNLCVLGPDKATVWQSPTLPEGSPPVAVDLTTPIEIALGKQVKAKQPLQATLTVSGDVPSRAFVTFGPVHGAVIRETPGVLTVALEGAPAALPLAAPLGAELPTSVVGDLTVRYEGLRILPEASDPLPPSFAAISGRIVGPSSALRVLPPRALEGRTPARVGILGRAAEDCELSVEFVRVVGTSAGPAFGPPSVLTLTASRVIELHWALAPQGLTLQGPIGLQVRANRGRFLWAAIDTGPIARIAVHEADPGGRPLWLGATSLVTVSAAAHEISAYAFPSMAFHDPVPQLTSDLFLTVDVSDLTLRYAR